MRLTPCDLSQVAGWTSADFEAAYPELLGVATEWADVLSKWSGSPFSEGAVRDTARFYPPRCCRALPAGKAFAEEEFAEAIFRERLTLTEGYKSFVARAEAGKYETPRQRLAEPDFYTVEQKMEARDALDFGWYGRG